MAATPSIDLDSDPHTIIGMREFDAPRDGADKGLVQTLARLSEFVAAMADC